ncbi:MAG: Gmad2 immunoglobulin-like domain-containing protein [Actinomycetota bacterium]|nr:Gmad2 immunoglobulin-like domain-containing protein [Actinomycetota bacterium]
MSRDPFEEMQKRNPVTSDELPVAPMSVAERILGRKAGRTMPGWALAAAAMFLVAAVGGGTLLWLGGGDAAPVGSGGDTTTTTLNTPVTTVPMRSQESLYFFMDPQSEGRPGGPFLGPVPVTVEVEGHQGDDAVTTLLLVRGVMGYLLEGPDGLALPVVEDVSIEVPEFTSAIPMGVSLGDTFFSDSTGVVEIGLSGDFVSGGGSASMRGRIAQVVYTLTAIEGVEGVRFFIDDVPTTVFGGEGVIVDDPATRDGFDDLLPAVMIESPAWGADAASPMVVKGTADVFEATVSIELRDASGGVLFEGFTTATCGTGCRGEWEIAIDYATSTISQAGEWGSLIAFESSAEDGRPTNVREHPVWLHGDATPGSSTTTSIVGYECSGALAADALVEPVGLPEAVARTRAEIWEAARACDWDKLQSLLGPDFSYSFGGQDDSIDAPIHHWQGLEDQGEDPIRFLAELLNRPFGTIASEGITYYVWPSAHTRPWEDVTDAEREALRPLYDEQALADFKAFGAYFGYRVGITDDGDWVYFIAGD